MSSSLLSEGIILIAVVVAAATLSQVFLASMTGIQSNSVSISERLGDKMKTSFEVITAVNSSSSRVKIWVKNTGTAIIPSALVKESDVFFGPIDDFNYVDYSETGPGWNFTLLNSNDANWQQSETIEILVTSSTSLVKADYYFAFISHNGVKDEAFFTVGG